MGVNEEAQTLVQMSFEIADRTDGVDVDVVDYMYNILQACSNDEIVKLAWGQRIVENTAIGKIRALPRESISEWFVAHHVMSYAVASIVQDRGIPKPRLPGGMDGWREYEEELLDRDVIEHIDEISRED